MGSPGFISEHDHLQPQGPYINHGRRSHGSSFDDTSMYQSYRGNDGLFADSNFGRGEENRQMHPMKGQGNQMRHPMRSDNYQLQHPQMHHDQQGLPQHQSQIRPAPHQSQGVLQSQQPQRSGDQRQTRSQSGNFQSHASFSNVGREQDYYDDGFGQQGHNIIGNQQQLKSFHHQRSSSGQFGPHGVPPQQDVFREPVTPGAGGMLHFEHSSGVGLGIEANRFDGHQQIHQSVSSGSDIGAVMNRSGNMPTYSTPSTPREGSSRVYGPSTIDPYYQNQQRFPGHQHPVRAGQGQFQHDGDLGHLYQPHLGVNRGLQQQFSGEEFHSGEVTQSDMIHKVRIERRGNGGTPVLPHTDEMIMNVNNVNMHGSSMGRGNDQLQGPYGGNVQEHRSLGQQQYFTYPGQRRIEPASPVSHHHGPIMLSPTQHHSRQHSGGLSFDGDVGHSFPVESLDGSPMGVGTNMVKNSNSANTQDNIVLHHHPQEQTGVLAARMGVRGGTMQHPAMSPSQSNGPGLPPVEQMVPTGINPHFSPIDSAQHQQQLTSGSVSVQSMSGPRVVYNVKFKRTQRSFILGQRIPRDIKIGCYVKVEADRGEDLGIVLSKMPAEKFNASGRSSFRMGVGSAPSGVSLPGIGEISPSIGGVVPIGTTPGGAADLKRIIRLATHDEVSLLVVKREEEDELLKICRAKVRQRGLPMNVVDAEYQFDRHKLTFFFEAEGRIDFRELVRDLFSIYKTRIWMQQLDKNGVGSGGCSDESSGNVSPSNDAGQSSVVSFASEDSASGRLQGSLERVSNDDKQREVNAKFLKTGDLLIEKGQNKEME